MAPVGIQRQTPTIQSPQQPLEVTQTHYLIQWQMRSFDGSLSRQLVCEQTSGVLRHTERVQDDKVQKQDWKQSSGEKVLRTARPPTQWQPQAQSARTQRFTAQYRPTSR